MVTLVTLDIIRTIYYNVHKVLNCTMRGLSMLMRRRLRGKFQYDKLTGVVSTVYQVSMRAEGHMRVYIDDKTSYRMVEVIYAFVKGKLPEHAKIIQLNGNKLDFRFSNLALDNSKMVESEMQKRGGFDFDRDKNKGINDV